MFQKTKERFDEYYRLLDHQNTPGFVRDLGCEVGERLEQLDYIIRRVTELDQTAAAAMSRSERRFREHVDRVIAEGLDYTKEPVPEDANVTKEEIQTHIQASFEMKLLTEAFYFFASRVRTILKHKSQPVPGLEGFECEGVRNVRNKLLEHPEGADSQIFTQSWASGGAQGPVHKALRYAGQETIFPDPGLYANAEEFSRNLDDILKRAFAAQDAAALK
jgi:hypothetical protein